MRIAHLRLGDSTLVLTHKSDGSMGGFQFCFDVEGLDAAVANLQRAGVVMVRSPHDTAAREPREKGWRRGAFGGHDGEQIELRG